MGGQADTCYIITKVIFSFKFKLINIMPTYKLVYFNVAGRGEIARLCFAQAGVEFEDFRYNFDGAMPPEWLEDKKAGLAPFDQLPYLDIDNGKHKVGQSLSIARYIARKHGLYGATLEEEAVIDSIVMATSDAVEFIGKLFFAKTSEAKQELSDKMQNQMERLENYFSANKIEGKPVFGSEITIADLFIFYMCDSCTNILGEAHSAPIVGEKQFPHLKKHFDFMAAQPRIVGWLAKRPKTSL